MKRTDLHKRILNLIELRHRINWAYWTTTQNVANQRAALRSRRRGTSMDIMNTPTAAAVFRLVDKHITQPDRMLVAAMLDRLESEAYEPSPEMHCFGVTSVIDMALMMVAQTMPREHFVYEHWPNRLMDLAAKCRAKGEIE